MPGVHHIALRVRDCEASSRFYQQAFDLREARRIESEGRLRAIWLRAGDVVLMLEPALRGKGDERGSGHVLIFPTPDLVAAEARFKAMGVEVTDRTAFTLYVEDPDGHRAGVSILRFDESAS